MENRQGRPSQYQSEWLEAKRRKREATEAVGKAILALFEATDDEATKRRRMYGTQAVGAESHVFESEALNGE